MIKIAKKYSILRKTFLILPVCLICISNLAGQTGLPKKNAIYYEFYGTGLGPISLNYERIFRLSDAVKFAPGIGLSLTRNLHIGGSRSIKDYQCLFPVQGNFLFGRSVHNLEIGFGIPLALDAEEFGLISGMYILRVGYRYQSKNSGLMLRASLTPAFIAIAPVILGGLSIGYTF